jgi:hypothetical protein
VVAAFSSVCGVQQCVQLQQQPRQIWQEIGAAMLQTLTTEKIVETTRGVVQSLGAGRDGSVCTWNTEAQQ